MPPVRVGLRCQHFCDVNVGRFFPRTCELGQCQELCGGARRSVVQLVQHNLLVGVEEVRAKSRNGSCWAANVVPEGVTVRKGY